MSNPPRFERMRRALESRLRKAGLPRGYIERYVEELEDHFEDLVLQEASAMSTEARERSTVRRRLGRPLMLTEAARQEMDRRNWFGRHPIVTFLVAPIPLVLLAWAAFFLVGFLLAFGMEFLPGDALKIEGRRASEWPTALIWGATIFHYLGAFVPPALVVALICRLAHRSGRSWRWTIAASLMVAVAAAAFTSKMDLPAEPGHGRLMLGFGMGLGIFVGHFAQFALPLGVMLLSLLWYSRRRPQPELA